MLPGFSPNQIKDLDQAREAIGIMLNLVEELKQENMILREQVQELRDEVNRLKGEHGVMPLYTPLGGSWLVALARASHDAPGMPRSARRWRMVPQAPCAIARSTSLNRRMK